MEDIQYDSWDSVSEDEDDQNLSWRGSYQCYHCKETYKYIYVIFKDVTKCLHFSTVNETPDLLTASRVRWNIQSNVTFDKTYHSRCSLQIFQCSVEKTASDWEEILDKEEVEVAKNNNTIYKEHIDVLYYMYSRE